MDVRPGSDGRARRMRIYGSWVPGAILILLGAVFLAQNTFGLSLRNWWALFILIPALGSLATAAELWQEGHGAAAGGAVAGGLGLVALALVFLLELPFGQLWPVLLIIAGLGLLFSRRDEASLSR